MTYSVPGVYVEEPFGMSLSIQTGATAVPVFAFDSSDQLAKMLGIVDKTVPLSSWLDISNLLQAKNKDEKDFRGGCLFESLKLYFINGGGSCYLAEVKKLNAVVPGLDDVTLLVQAGALLADFKSAVNELCKKGNAYFAIFDGPKEQISKVTDVKTKQDDYEKNQYAAVYYPWLSVAYSQSDGTVDEKEAPPSGAIAGVYARVDRERGVWKAPANVEIVGATPKFKVPDDIDGKLNVTDGGKSINVIRSFRGTGTLIWGARTLETDQTAWKYVPVRRLFCAAEKDIRTAMSTALFEPNSAPTWERVRSAVENYVHSLWEQGALLGDTPEQAYFVHIGRGITMTDEQIKSGTMVLKVGLSAVRPAEFIVLQLTQDVVPA
ncbi:phage tail sheath family protein [Chromobacterium haemolyticum]|uniref:phage tail sheath family protein n=1 Tax=Chromobacterium haemolyticum TaxID=394935 RepID=UPI00244BFA42|nr:phage tail sheath C-terminal domain-containing protein [Chromobacterium haemolyticum]MDH0342418.1 phage tail sheath subtilisin-like domain-containing protein [Chromobacterium haemolyticum]